MGGCPVEFGVTEVNVRSSLSTPRRRMWGVNVQLQSFIMCARVAGEWSASRSGRFNPGVSIE